MSAERPHILVVDDEPQITRVLRTTLTAHGYDLRVANDGEMDAPPDHHRPRHAPGGWHSTVPESAGRF
jgi:CheY-like chemotaxis protein